MLKQLTEVLKAAYDDEKFREDLLTDHSSALQSKGWELSSEHQKQLDDFMAGKLVADPKTTLRALSSAAKGDSPWEPPPWSLDQPKESK